MNSKLGTLLAALIAFVSTPAPAQWQNSPEVKALYEKAKTEGKVTIWALGREVLEWIPKSFNEMFPGIEVQWFADTEIATKAITEARGGRNDVDVYLHWLAGTVPLIRRDMIAAVDWTPFNVPKDVVWFDGRSANLSNSIVVVAYNRDLVAKSDVPKKWADLIDAKYKGKMVATAFGLPRLLGVLSMVWGKDKAVEFAQNFMSNTDIMLTRAPREPIIHSGERLFAVAEIDTQVRNWAKAGLKVDYVAPEPVLMTQFVANVMAKAPHPNAARLLAGYLVSPEGIRARAAVTSVEDYTATGTSELARDINSGKLQVLRDVPSDLEAREKAIAEMVPIVMGRR